MPCECETLVFQWTGIFEILCLIYSTYKLVLLSFVLRIFKWISNCDLIFRAVNTCEKYDVWWGNFKSNFLRNQPNSQHRLPMSPPSSHWWWSHRICVIPNSAMTPEIEIRNITEQKFSEGLHLFNFLIRSVITDIKNVRQASSKHDSY